MVKLTFDEIVSKLSELEVDAASLAEEDFDDEDAVLAAVGETKVVYREGGNEGGGEHAERVTHFVDHDVFIRVTGYYASDYGTEWDGDFEEVFPRRIIITTYEDAKTRGDKTDEA